MTDYDRLWQIVTDYDSLQQIITDYDRLWHIMTYYDKLWQIMTDHYRSWSTFAVCCLFSIVNVQIKDGAKGSIGDNTSNSKLKCNTISLTNTPGQVDDQAGDQMTGPKSGKWDRRRQEPG